MGDHYCDLIAGRSAFFCNRRVNLASQRLDNPRTEPGMSSPKAAGRLVGGNAVSRIRYANRIIISGSLSTMWTFPLSPSVLNAEWRS